MPDIISDRAHHATVSTSLQKSLSTVKSKRLARFCKATKALFQPKCRKTASPKSTGSPAQQSTVSESPASSTGKTYSLPPLLPSFSFEEDCTSSLDAVIDSQDAKAVLKEVVAKSLVVVENKATSKSSGTLHFDPDAARKSLALTRVAAHISYSAQLVKDSFDLVRDKKPHLIASDRSQELAASESISDVVQKTMQLAPTDQKLVNAGAAYLNALEAAKPTAEKHLTVTFKQQREQQSGAIETILETAMSIHVTQRTTMQELRYKLQREAVLHVTEAPPLPGEIFGTIFLVLGSSSTVLTNDEWQLMRMGLPSAMMSLQYCFQIRELGDEDK